MMQYALFQGKSPSAHPTGAAAAASPAPPLSASGAAQFLTALLTHVTEKKSPETLLLGDELRDFPNLFDQDESEQDASDAHHAGTSSSTATKTPTVSPPPEAPLPPIPLPIPVPERLSDTNSSQHFVLEPTIPMDGALRSGDDDEAPPVWARVDDEAGKVQEIPDVCNPCTERNDANRDDDFSKNALMRSADPPQEPRAPPAPPVRRDLSRVRIVSVKMREAKEAAETLIQVRLGRSSGSGNRGSARTSQNRPPNVPEKTAQVAGGNQEGNGTAHISTVPRNPGGKDGKAGKEIKARKKKAAPPPLVETRLQLVRPERLVAPEADKPLEELSEQDGWFNLVHETLRELELKAPPPPPRRADNRSKMSTGRGAAPKLTKEVGVEELPLPKIDLCPDIALVMADEEGEGKVDSGDRIEMALERFLDYLDRVLTEFFFVLGFPIEELFAVLIYLRQPILVLPAAPEPAEVVVHSAWKMRQSMEDAFSDLLSRVRISLGPRKRLVEKDAVVSFNIAALHVQRMAYRMAQRVRMALQRSIKHIWTRVHFVSPYISTEDKRIMSLYTGDSDNQLTDYFTNYRTRAWRKEIESIQLEDDDQEYDDDDFMGNR